MTFYVQKSLALGPIRFGVSPRQVLEDIDAEARLSTGSAGEFLRRRTTGFYFADTRPVGIPTLPPSRRVSSMPFLSWLRPTDARGWGFIALMAFGVILFLLGFAVVSKKGPQGWIEVILGAAMIATPLILTAQKRRQLRQQEEIERAERERRERRERDMLASYVDALDQVRRNPDEETLRAVTAAEREKLELPYNLWSPLARHVVLDIGFRNLDPRLLTAASRAVGLSSDDETGVRLDIYRTLVWHLLADDRLGTAQEQTLKDFRKLFDIGDREVPVESQAVEEFRKLRGITRENLPRQQCGIPLQFREYCIHSTRGTMLNEKGVPQGTFSLFVTNKRLFADGKTPIEVELSQIDDVEVDVDGNILTVTIARPAKPLRVQVEQPIYTAAIIDLATTIDERPKGFA